MNDQPTPETNKFRASLDCMREINQRDRMVSFARQLERNLTEARGEIIGWRNKWDCAIEMAARAENALDEMTLRWERTNDALFDERALSDQLADALRDFLNSHLVDAALTAWKEARK